MSGRPLNGSVLDSHTEPLFLGPAPVLLDERVGFTPRTTPRNRDAQRSIRPDTNDVLSRTTLAHEKNRQTTRGDGGTRLRNR